MKFVVNGKKKLKKFKDEGFFFCWNSAAANFILKVAKWFVRLG